MPEDRTIDGVLFRWNEEMNRYETTSGRTMHIRRPGSGFSMWRVKIDGDEPTVPFSDEEDGQKAFEFGALCNKM